MARNQRPPRHRPWLAGGSPVLGPGALTRLDPRTVEAELGFPNRLPEPANTGPHPDGCQCVKCVFGADQPPVTVLVVEASLDGNPVRLELPVDELGMVRGIRKEISIPRAKKAK